MSHHRNSSQAFSMVVSLVFSLLITPPALAASDAEPEKEPPAKAQYVKLHPDFLVNLKNPGKERFLMVTAQAMSRSDSGIEAIKKHMPAIRHQMLLLLADQSYDDIKSVQNKQVLMDKALATIREVLKKESEPGDVEGLFFTNFIIE